MINKIIAFSIKQKLVVGFLVLILIIFGIYSAFNLPIDAVPDITNNQIQIITASPTLAASEIERFITYPIEIAMANIPDLVELRSISKFGISVVTIVFKDNVDIYFARNLVFQRLKEAEENIPNGLGKPEMAPISTGLGEIYMYVVRPVNPNDSTYNILQLREIQDWIIKRQLLGTPGVAEVNSFGGFEKQYQILINADALKSYNLTLREVFEAVSRNNANVGGAYIEKGSEQYTIRGIGIIENIKDIENIILNNDHSAPLFLKNVADVVYGGALRFGSVTQDGKGEVVSGIVMMLKGANSREVANTVHNKMNNIKQSLPKGVTIDEYYNRENLVSKTIATVEKNLVEGGIIVIAVLFLLVGNLRAGLIVASVIPLSMLFAVIMMNTFGVSGNLMSLGAIDFGLIVDGAVIIVEAVIVAIGYRIHTNKKALAKEEIEETVYNSASTIIKSAVFGILIILVVYLPIFALGGIEGKMFKPMAFTVGFALVGALILSLTYVPMMCSLILSGKIKEKQTIADKIMNSIKKIYTPLLEIALKNKIIVITIAIIFFGVSVLTFTNLGGEFIPELDEGDLLIQCIRLPGVSLTESNIVTTKIETILKKFPEVKTVVSRTGAAEIATDPMGVELTDIFIILKPKDEWTSAVNKEELVEMMLKELSVIPGVGYQVTQPIEMRFNELISGARSDIAVKIYGDDLEILSVKGNEVAKIISGVNGAEDVSVQQLEGLPQLEIKIEREKIAKHKINIDDVNDVIQIALAGKTAGVVFEGDKKFDIVVKYKSDFKQDIEKIKNIVVPSPAGYNIPLAEITDISIQEGAAEITRDNGKRRIIVQNNVRGRDIESFIEDIRSKISTGLELPPGYIIEYGGQFQNLQSAKDRLLIAVPAALFLIFTLLFITFNSIKQGLLVFSGIPFAVVGGVFALIIRNMPFSISAGVGFIALFGVAVLNGIVMIAYFNRLEDEGEKNVHERIIKGTSVRLRPILMTALVASFGFIPMAISQGAGAEVQRPLATVVIGGLISSTILTLIVLPVLYGIFYKHANPKYSFGKITLLLLGLLLPLSSNTQTKSSLDDVIKISMENNQQIKSAKYNLEKEDVLKLKAVNIPKPQLFVEYEGIKGNLNNFENRKIGVLQEFEFPSTYFLRSDVQSSQVLIAKAELNNLINELKFSVKQSYINLLLQTKLLDITWENLKIYEDFLFVAQKNYDAGASTNLEVLGAKVNKIKFENEIRNVETQIRIIQSELKKLMNVDYAVIPSEELTYKEHLLIKDNLLKNALINNPELIIARFQKEKSSNKISLSKSELLPNFSLKYYSQKIGNVGGFWGFEAGIGIPLWFWWEQSGNIKESKYEYKIAESNEINIRKRIESDFNQAFEEHENRIRELKFFKDEAIGESSEILRQAKISYEEGAIGYVEYLQALNVWYDTNILYLNSIFKYNSSINELEKITVKPIGMQSGDIK